jgi:hypothetical protein
MSESAASVTGDTPGPAAAAAGSARPRLGALPALLGFQAVFWTQFAWVRMTNFAGFDEWLLIALLARGVRDYPYANRPLMLWWSVPASLLTPNGLAGYYVMQAMYSSLIGWLTFLVCRRVWPERAMLAFLAGIFAMVWAPSDMLRLQSVSLLAYPGATCGMLLAILGLLESWRRGSPVLLALAATAALAVSRSFEAVVPTLLAAPLLLPLRPRNRRFWIWVAAWEAAVVIAIGLTMLPLLRPQEFSYQLSLLRLDLNPRNVAGRLLRMYSAHLLPVAEGALSVFGIPAAWLAVVVFLAAAAAWKARFADDPPGRESRRPLAVGCVAGLAAAGLGYATLSLSSTGGPAGSEFISAPGIALFLASASYLMASAAPSRLRHALALALASWLVGVGTARTLLIQAAWDRDTYHRPQHKMLVQLLERVPEVAPHTLVVVLDERGAWRAVFTLRNIVEYLYERRATAYVWPAHAIFYPARFTETGILCEPWEVIREPWQSPVTHHRYDEMILLRYTKDERLELLVEWPAGLPRLPAGARYDPAARIARPASTPRERALLRRSS